MLKERISQLKQAKSFKELEDLYFQLANDFAILNESWIEWLPEIQREQKEIKQKTKTISQAERDYKLSPVYLVEKKFRLEIETYKKLLPAIRFRLESLKSEWGEFKKF